MDTIDLLLRVHMGSIPIELNQLDAKSELNEISATEKAVAELAKLLKKKDDIKLVIRALAHLSTLENFIKWVEHPIHLNEFKDKYGNVYLQARSSIRDSGGKINWINAYVGTKSNFPKGVNDPAALEKAKPLIRKKLKKYFGLK